MKEIFRGYKMCQNFTNSISKILGEIETAQNNRQMRVVKEVTRVRPYTVLVEGNIGSGKTTFLENFNKFGEDVEVLVEPVEKWRDARGHNLLQMMYEDPDRWSLMFQTYVQLTMVQNHTKITNKSVKLMERSLYSAKYCFVENLLNSGKMPACEYEVLNSWFEFLLSCNQVDLGVDLIVYMRTDPEVALSRMRSRSRGEESLIAEKYIRDLHNLHEDWLVHGKNFLPAPVLVIDANKDLEEMQEVFARQEALVKDIVAEQKDRNNEDKENIIVGKMGAKRPASHDYDVERKKTVLAEVNQV